MKSIYNEDMTPKDEEFIKELIDSKIDYSKEANEDKSEIEQLEEFIISTWNPKLDAINQNIFINNDPFEVMDDPIVNDMYIACKKNFDASFKVQIADIRSIIFSNSIEKIDNVKIFFNTNSHNEIGFIEDYARCIKPETEYNVWAFTRWIVGMVHNWTADRRDKIVCPLTLVLSGQAHGVGKSSFFRNILPEQLENYIAEKKVDVKDKDHLFLLASRLMLIDQEFGGAVKDVKDYKAFSDENIITQRRPFERMIKSFKRRAILGGTTNEKNILRDVTGDQRRLLPINVITIDYEKMLTIDKASMLVEAYNMLREGFEWNIYKSEDVQYIKDNTEENEDVMPIEEIFLSFFSKTKTSTHTEKRIVNQGDILQYLNAHSLVKPSKYDVKDIIAKQKLNYTTHRKENGDQKKGYELFMPRESADIFYKERGEN